MKKPFEFEPLANKRSVERTVTSDGLTSLSAPVSAVHASAMVRSDIRRLFSGSKELVQRKYGESSGGPLVTPGKVSDPVIISTIEQPSILGEAISFSPGSLSQSPQVKAVMEEVSKRLKTGETVAVTYKAGPLGKGVAGAKKSLPRAKGPSKPGK